MVLGFYSAVDVHGIHCAGGLGSLLLRPHGVSRRYSGDTAVAYSWNVALQRGNVQVSNTYSMRLVFFGGGRGGDKDGESVGRVNRYEVCRRRGKRTLILQLSFFVERGQCFVGRWLWWRLQGSLDIWEDVAVVTHDSFVLREREVHVVVFGVLGLQVYDSSVPLYSVCGTARLGVSKFSAGA